MASRTIVTVTYLLLIGLFAYTASSKLLSIGSFKDVLWQASFLGGAANIVAWLVPLSELLVAGLLLVPSSRKLGLFASALILTLFTAYIGYMLLFSPHLPCQCGGIISALDWKSHLLVNLLFLASADANPCFSNYPY